MEFLLGVRGISLSGLRGTGLLPCSLLRAPGVACGASELSNSGNAPECFGLVMRRLAITEERWSREHPMLHAKLHVRDLDDSLAF